MAFGAIDGGSNPPGTTTHFDANPPFTGSVRWFWIGEHNERDCIVRTYTMGEVLIDPGQGNI